MDMLVLSLVVSCLLSLLYLVLIICGVTERHWWGPFVVGVLQGMALVFAVYGYMLCCPCPMG